MGVSVVKASENSPQDGFTIIAELQAKKEINIKINRKKQLKDMIKALLAVAGNYMVKIMISVKKSFKILYPYLEDPTRILERSQDTFEIKNPILISCELKKRIKN